MGKHSREAEKLQGITVIYSVQSHDHLEYAAGRLVKTRLVYEREVDLLRKNENSEVNCHLPRRHRSVVALAKARLMKAYEQFAFNGQVDDSLNHNGQYVEPTVQRVWEDLYSKPIRAIVCALKN